MANYHKRNSIRAVQWDPENAQSFEDIKKLIAENPGMKTFILENIHIKGPDFIDWWTVVEVPTTKEENQ